MTLLAGGPAPPRESKKFEVPILFLIDSKLLFFGGVAGGPINSNPVEPLPGFDKFCDFGFWFLIGLKLFVSGGGREKLDPPGNRFCRGLGSFFNRLKIVVFGEGRFRIA